MEFGDYLKELRENNKLSIRQLALYSKVSASYLSQIEKGTRGVPKPEILLKLHKPLKVTYEELMERAGYLLPDSTEQPYEPLSEINKLIKKYNVESFGFFDIEKWKNFTPDDVDELRRHFEWVSQKAKERSEEKD